MELAVVKTVNGILSGEIELLADAPMEERLAAAKDYVQRRTGMGWEQFQRSTMTGLERLVPRGVAEGIQTAAQGVTFGGLDELVGLIDEDAQERIRLRRNVMRAEAPVLAAGLEIAGGAVGPGLGAIRLGKGLRGAATVGAAEGAAYGALAADGDLEKRATEGAIGAGIGAAGTAAIRAVGSGVGAVRGALADRRARAQGGEIASAMVRAAASADDIADLPAALARRQAEAPGAPLMPGDLGPNMQAVASGAMHHPATKAAAQKAVRERSYAREGRIDELLDRAFTPATSGDAVTAINRYLRETASPMFDQAFAEGVPMDRYLAERLSRPAVRSAWRKAATLAANEGRRIPELRLRNGQIAQVPDLEAWHYIKMALDDQVDRLYRGGNKVEATGIRSLRNEIREHLKELNPTYASALEHWSGPKRMQDALEAGRGLFGSGDASREALRRLDQLQDGGERLMFTLGASTRLREVLEETPRTANEAWKMLRTRRMRRTLERLFNEAQDAQRAQRAQQGGSGGALVPTSPQRALPPPGGRSAAVPALSRRGGRVEPRLDDRISLDEFMDTLKAEIDMAQIETRLPERGSRTAVLGKEIAEYLPQPGVLSSFGMRDAMIASSQPWHLLAQPLGEMMARRGIKADKQRVDAAARSAWTILSEQDPQALQQLLRGRPINSLGPSFLRRLSRALQAGGRPTTNLGQLGTAAGQGALMHEGAN